MFSLHTVGCKMSGCVVASGSIVFRHACLYVVIHTLNSQDLGPKLRCEVSPP